MGDNSYQFFEMDLDEKICATFHRVHGYKLQIHQIYSNGFVVGFITNMYVQDNWRVFSAQGSQLPSSRKWNETSNLDVIKQEISKLNPFTFNPAKFIVVVKTQYGMTHMLGIDPDGYFCVNHGKPFLFSQEECDVISLKSVKEVLLTLPGDHIINIDVVPFSLEP